jgi:S-DNA-T family DNA segregation ATPase FtsK/SpoIIIE
VAGNRKNSPKKKNNQNSKRTYKRNTKVQTVKRENKDQFEMKMEIMIWSALAVSILLFISNFGLGGVVGEGVSFFLFGLMGILAYIFPVFLLLGTVFLISNRENQIAKVKFIATMVLLVFLCVFSDLLTHESEIKSGVMSYLYSANHKTGGGFIGGFIGSLLMHFFGLVGAYVITAIILILSCILIFEKSTFRYLKEAQEDHNREADYRRQERERRRQIRRQEMIEERERKRKEKFIQGTFDGTVTDINETSSDNMNEIKMAESMDVSNVNRVKLSSDQPSESVIHPTSAKAETDAVNEITFHGDFDTTPQKAPVKAELPRKAEIPVKVETPVKNAMPSRIETPAKEAIPAQAEVEKVSKKQQKEEAAAESNKIAEEVKGQETEHKDYVFPPIDLLKKNTNSKNANTKMELQETAHTLQQTLKNFGVNVTVTDVSCGPAVTRYELQPEMGVKVSKIVNLQDDIKLNLAAADIRIEAPIPGKAAVGIEVPNKTATMVGFRELVESTEFQTSAKKSNISFAAGKDIAGNVVISDIAKMPHLLIAGATGSGKSVCINTIIMSILYHANPDDVKFIMIDPKVVELSVYNGIPHLLIPVVTDPKKAAGALHWAVKEMTDRYQKFADLGVRDMKSYNARIHNGTITMEKNGETIEVATKKMPQIVVIVDELADLMMVASKEVEEAICRLAQLARAAGIHLIIATQRPSVNVITGLIKANMPSRIAFSVTSGVDSRTILDMVGAEKLLGKGDMLYYPQGYTKPLRVQGAFVSDEEVAHVVNFLKDNNEYSYDEEIQNNIVSVETQSSGGIGTSDDGDERDQYFEQAGRLIIEKQKGSIGMLQRNFKIGFNRAARIMDQLEESGVVGPEEGTKPRRVLMAAEDFDQLLS